MIEIRPLQAEDILYVIENGVKEYSLKRERNEQISKLAEERAESGNGMTGLVDGEIIGCGGIDLLWEGVGEVWLMLTPSVNKRPVESYKCIRDGLEKLIEKSNLRRVQGYGRIGFHEAHNLFQHLGFKVEGKLKEFTPDKIDCILYARIK